MTRPRATERPTRAPVLKFDLHEAFDDLRSEDEWKSRPRNAITLLKEPGLRVVLTALKQGASLEPHRAEGPITIHVLSGALRVKVGNETLQLGPGQIAAIEPGLEHDARADEESSFLLTIGG